ncbi:MAG: hypothetical protein HIU89_13245 [Proteobacteria bacterium]|nr:hypothetical protein [Pseudomonadota bacterium]
MQHLLYASELSGLDVAGAVNRSIEHIREVRLSGDALCERLRDQGIDQDTASANVLAESLGHLRLKLGAIGAFDIAGQCRSCIDSCARAAARCLCRIHSRGEGCRLAWKRLRTHGFFPICLMMPSTCLRRCSVASRSAASSAVRSASVGVYFLRSSSDGFCASRVSI